jgi:hypothetical protein
MREEIERNELEDLIISGGHDEDGLDDYDDDEFDDDF